MGLVLRWSEISSASHRWVRQHGRVWDFPLVGRDLVSSHLWSLQGDRDIDYSITLMTPRPKTGQKFSQNQQVLRNGSLNPGCYNRMFLQYSHPPQGPLPVGYSVSAPKGTVAFSVRGVCFITSHSSLTLYAIIKEGFNVLVRSPSSISSYGTSHWSPVVSLGPAAERMYDPCGSNKMCRTPRGCLIRCKSFQMFGRAFTEA